MSRPDFMRAFLLGTTAAVLAAPVALAQDAQDCRAQVDDLERRLQEVQLQGSEQDRIRQLLDEARRSMDEGQTQVCVDVVAALQQVLPSEQPQQQATGDIEATEIVVEQPQPSVRLEQVPPRVTVEQQQPRITIHQPAPEISVNIPPPQITVDVPPPLVNVEQRPPQISLEQERPQVRVQTAEPEVLVRQEEGAEVMRTGEGQEPEIAVSSAEGEPQVEYRAEDAQIEVRQAEAEVNVQQAEPEVTVQTGDGPAVQAAESGGSAGAQGAETTAQQQAAGAEDAGAAASQIEPAAGAGAMGNARQALEENGITNVEGFRVLNQQGVEIGDVDYIAQDDQGQLHIIMSLNNGVLGVGDSERAVPLDAFDFLPGQEALQLNQLSEAEIETMPDWDTDTAGYTTIETDLEWANYN